MTIHTYNHPHWKEGSWDNPLLSPAPSLEDLTTDNSELTEPGEKETSGPEGFNLIEIIGGAFGQILEGLGNVFSGIWDAGSAILSPVIDGISNFIGSIVNGISNAIRNIFGGGSGPPPVTVIEDPELWSPIKTNLEAALKPRFDLMDESFEEIDIISGTINGLQEDAANIRQEQQQLRGQMEATNGQLGDINAEAEDLSNRISAINTDIQNKFGPGGEIDARMDAMMDSLDTQLEDSIFLSTKLESIKSDLSGEIGSMSTTLSSQIDSKVSVVDTKIGSLKSATEAEYRKINDDLWGSQGELNKLNADMYKSNGKLWKLNDKLWGSQGELNKLNNLMWDSQGVLNQDFRDLFDMQAQFNDAQTGFNKKMTEFNAIQTKFNHDTLGWQSMQDELNQINESFVAEQEKRDKEQEKILRELQAAMEDTQSYVSRILPIPGTAISNDHFEVTRLTGGGKDGWWRVRAKGANAGEETWVGQMVWQGVWNNEGAASLDIFDVGATRQWDIPSINHHASSITYWVNEGTVVTHNPDKKSFALGTGAYHNIWTYTVPAGTPSTTAQIYFRVGWGAASYDDWYGIRATRNNSSTADSVTASTIVGQVIKRKNLGPVLPGQNGYRTMTVSELNVPIKGGDVLRFQAHCSASQASRRYIRDTSLNVNFIDHRG